MRQRRQRIEVSMQDETVVNQANTFLYLYYGLLGPKKVAVEIEPLPEGNLQPNAQKTLKKILKFAQSIHASRHRKHANATLVVKFGEEFAHMDNHTHTLTIYISNSNDNMKKIVKMGLVILIALLILRTFLRAWV